LRKSIIFNSSLIIVGKKVKDKVRILVGVDGSSSSKRALVEAVSCAKNLSGFVKVIMVHKRSIVEKAEKVLEEAKQYLEEKGVEHAAKAILGSNPARALITTSEHEDFDLIVVGSRGWGSKASILLGSVSRQVVADAECNVLVVKK
jgi:nucleotide-binding universal stress UspA family protein